MKVLDDSERKELLKELFDALDPQKMGEDFRAALALDDEEKLIHAAAWHFRTRAPRNYCRNIDRSRCSEKTAEQAKKLLRESDLSVAEISEALAFDSPCYFSKTFKKHVKQTPLQYRNTQTSL